ncbi:alkaline phosphatase family protein [Robiginitalea sp. SC105]|uniref:alkaline phosphatase family protein n=1 Tax=Robiginitalea sp. SC105 TaxID=2762332 RepID=UPI001639A966|nr:alkaline phosphatase family protein [Robiginitalea sp. SC105]MBC2838469.1 alkaline phosphatase family protein [Robiginitalea sp. SC105]
MKINLPQSIRTNLFCLLFFHALFTAIGQTAQEPAPKLVVGIVIDQMRYDYLYKYQDHYSEDGFKRLLREGFSYDSTNYNYIPTVTAAGHSSIYTGTTPSKHGIVGNSWYDRQMGAEVSNVGDDNVRITGSVVPNPYGKSPVRLLAPTITDELRTEMGEEAKVISVSLKDRGAILPGGRKANAAYWHDYSSSPGYFVTSSFYRDSLPDWVVSFNEEGRSEKYMGQTWNTLLPLKEYDESAPDDNPHESIMKGKDAPVFPYDLAAIRDQYRRGEPYLNVLWATPFGNTLLKDFAIRALREEQLGQDETTDMLCISFSSPDVAGHTFGPQSVEVQDMYLRLDRDIAELLNTLDKEVGADNYLLFLTSDHGVHPVVSYAVKNGLPAGLAVIPKYQQDLNFALGLKFGAFQWIESFGVDQVYLNHKLIKEQGVSLREMQQAVAEFMEKQREVRYALTASDLEENKYDSGLQEMMQNGFYADRSGDVMLIYQPGVTPTYDFRTPITAVRGASHGLGYEPDTHVPLVWFGAGIPSGASPRMVHPTDIAPTLARLLNLKAPDKATGDVLGELFEAAPAIPQE